METHVRGDGEQGSGPAEDELNSHAQRAKHLFGLSRSAWLDKERIDPAAAERYQDFAVKEPIRDHQQVRKAASKSHNAGENKSRQGRGLAASSSRDPEVHAQESVTVARLRDWLYGDKVRNGTNAKQHAFLELVVDRVLVELELIEPDQSIRRSSEPLAWLLHGPPGAGKSHALPLLRELFEDLLGYKQGIDYEIMALQAVNAVDIRGETIHKAFGMNERERRTSTEKAKAAAQRIGYWRWVIVDEISMVSAKLLAKLEQQQREYTPSQSAFKRDAAGKVRHWGGANMIFLGDFYQLPPPEGGFLGDVPRCLASTGATEDAGDPAIERGRELFWQGGVQGVTELTEILRCDDPWWNEVVEQLRQGCLSEENHRYLHGLRVEGCTLSPEERASRKRVIDHPNDPRLQEPKFREAMVILANNDARYQINKDKARAYSQRSGAPLRWSVARDVASAEALQAQDCSKEAKRKWLQYHDRRTGDLCGLLPLAIGLPVALTDHIDRSRDKHLLRGRQGHVHSWLWRDNENMPDVVYVKFADADWQLPGTPEPGIYPLRPKTVEWCLDEGRGDRKVLKVKRTQIQLTPAFACTAYSSQGKTLKAAVLDLNVDKNVHQTLGTVAASRVRSRHDVLILRPFPLWLFNRGAPEGPTLLLRTLRQDHVDWTAYREAKRPFAACQACGLVKELEGFSYKEWQKIRTTKPGKCLRCANGEKGPVKRKLGRADLAKHLCNACGCHKIELAFPQAQLRQARKQCTRCAEDARQLRCAVCNNVKDVSTDFVPAMRTLPPAAIACQECQRGVRKQSKRSRAGWFLCQGCREDFPIAAAGNTSEQHCLNCASRQAAPRLKGWLKCRTCQKSFQHRGGPWRPQRCPECRRAPKACANP